MTDYAKLLAQRAQAETPTRIRQAHLLLDSDTYERLTADMAQAEADLQAATIRLEALQEHRADQPKRKMNTPNPTTQAKAELETAQQRLNELAQRMQECFITLHLRGITSTDITQIAMLDAEQRDTALFAKVLVKVTDPAGETIAVDPTTVATVVAATPREENAAIWEAVAKAGEAPKYPTLPKP